MHLRVYDSRVPLTSLHPLRPQATCSHMDSRDTLRQSAPSPSLDYSLTHAHRSIGYRNRNPQPLVESTARLMHLRVHDRAPC
jgi:hypothetical protein